eukprot:1235151-Ditylum_brightwellii.AAC.1
MEFKLFQNFKLETSCNDNPVAHKQTGSTCIALVNNMVGRKISSVEDKSGLGQWSYILNAGGVQEQVVIVTGYKHCIKSTLH